MKHFSEQGWIDFVRGVPDKTVGSAARADLESHLASGCGECAETFGFWRDVYGIAAREGEYSPPENAARMAKLEFGASQKMNAAETIEAGMVFDTLSQPLLAGVRSAASAARQMVYEAEGLTVDLRFDRQPYSNKVHLVGQVLDAAKSRTVFPNFPVMLSTDQGMLVAESRTNCMGEFQVEFEAQDQLKLSIWVGANKLIRIALANLQQKMNQIETRPS